MNRKNETSAFRPMRRSRQQLSESRSREVLKRNTAGVLALEGDSGYPYAVPISYAYDEDENCIYFHSAISGHKIDSIRRNPKVSFCVVDQDTVVPEKYTTFFRSVTVFGKMEILEDEQTKYEAIRFLGQKYAPLETKESMDQEISKFWKVLAVLKLDIEHMSGKEAIELIRTGSH